jgi:hypothetical protein
LAAVDFLADARVLRAAVPRRAALALERREAVRGLVERIARSPCAMLSIISETSSFGLLRRLIFLVRGIVLSFGVIARLHASGQFFAERDRSRATR